MLANLIKTGAFYLSLTINSRKVDRLFITRTSPVSEDYEPPIPGSLRVGAVQLRPQINRSLRDYVNQMEEGVKKAAAAGAHLVVYPQYTGLLPLTLLPRFDRMVEELHRLERDRQNFKDAFWLILEHLSDFLLETYTATFSALAKFYGVYLLAGSTYVYEEGRITHRSYLFDPKGEVVATQNKLVLSPFERTFGVYTDQELSSIPSPLGELCILFEDDLSAFEPAKIVSNMGCRLILCPGGQTTAVEPEGRVLHRNLWPLLRAQEQGVFVARGAMVGEIAGLSFEGEAAVYAPYRLTKSKDGRMVRFPSDDQSGVAVAHCDDRRLSEGADLLAADQNEMFYRDQLLPLYERPVGPLPVLELRPKGEHSPSAEILLDLLDKMPAMTLKPDQNTSDELAEEFDGDIDQVIKDLQEPKDLSTEGLRLGDWDLDEFLNHALSPAEAPQEQNDKLPGDMDEMPPSL